MTKKSTVKWTPKFAYAVGLIVTDGSLSSDKRHIVFTSQEMELIVHIKNIFSSTNKVGKTKNAKSESYRVQIGNVLLYRQLESLGITTNKSLTIGAIRVPDKYFVDFLRGHLDGDGSITSYIDHHNAKKNPKYIYPRLWIRFISGSKKHIVWLQSKIEKIIGVSGRIHITKPNNNGNSMSILKFGKNESLKLIYRIYYSKDIPCLTRKKQIAEDFIKKYTLK